MRFRYLTVFVLSIAMVAAAAGCGGKSKESDDDVARGADTGASGNASNASGDGAMAGYKVIQVTNGGVIAGRVTIEGKAPKLPDFEIASDKSACASAARNNRLSVGTDGGIAEAVIYLEGVKEGKAMPAPAPGSLVMDQRGCQYAPHIVAAPVGSTVTFTNSDDVPHNVRVEDPATDAVLMNRAQPTRGQRDPMQITKAGPVSVGCDYHPWMNAYLFGVENPYYAVTSADGRFTIDGVPPGRYTVKMWLNGVTPSARKDNQGRLIRYYYSEPYIQQKPVTMGSGGAITVDFAVAPR